MLKRRPTAKQDGVTMVELMIATTVGLLLSTAVAALFLQNKQSYTQNEHISFIQDNGKYALSTITNDLSAVDYWGGISDLGNINTSGLDIAFSAGNACVAAAGATYDPTIGLSFLPQPSAATVTATFPCITSFDAGTSILLVKRVRGLSINTLTNKAIYLRVTNKKTGYFFAQDSTEPARTSEQADWEYFFRLYYIDGGNLKRKTIATNPPTNPPTMAEETLAEGIEMFHVEFGIDDNNDKTADYFISNPTNAQLNNAVVTRVHILARADSPMLNYENDKTYNLGDLVVAATNDEYLRRSYTASTPMRNVLNLR